MKKLCHGQLAGLLFFTMIPLTVWSQVNSSKGSAFVDSLGVIRWENGSEVKGFGVNYSVPFAHAYRVGKTLGVNLREAIDRDVYHFSRLGFDLYRLHIWDTEISDEQGNLLENEHLDLFDYLIHKLKERNINFILTPIAYWGNGWPEPDEDTPGFSDRYGKAGSLTDPGAIRAQQRYLTQFLNHVNPYTGKAYKEEPNLIALEISNEPHHRGTPASVTAFIDEMVSAIRSTGTEKPIFYNASHSIYLAPAYAAAEIQGGTFQWYPTGLGFGEELSGNLLPNVDIYRIPFDSLWRREGLAKIVYEFDAADMMKSYMYPAMARSFREAGIQLATHFAYDPTYMAFANTEYNTHYMNLAYTPAKALGLMISGRIFHELPMYRDQGSYPQNMSFGDFRIDPENDLAEYISGKEFIHTNNTPSTPEDIEALNLVAGAGSSPIVAYDGTGAYFLNKLRDGLWRLELLPDAVLVDNPFGRNSLKRAVAVIQHMERKMTIQLPDLGDSFFVRGINRDNKLDTQASDGAFLVVPGTYLLSKSQNEAVKELSGWSREELTAYAAPEPTVNRTHLVHDPVPVAGEGSDLHISARIVSDEAIQKVAAWLRNGNSYQVLDLRPDSPYLFRGKVPDTLLRKGYLEYRIIVTTEDQSVTFPGAVPGNPGQWDFSGPDPYSTTIVGPERPLYLFRAFSDTKTIVGPWREGNRKVPATDPGEAEYQVHLEKLFEKDVENPNAEPIYDYSFRFNFRDRIRGRSPELEEKNYLVLKARSLMDHKVPLQVALVQKDGSSFGRILELSPEIREYKIKIRELKRVPTVILPRPYPTFLPYFFKSESAEEFRLQGSEALQFSIGPGLNAHQFHQPQGVGIISVRLE